MGRRAGATRVAPGSAATTIDTAKPAQIVGTPGEQTGAVYKITIGRDDLKLTEMGAPINARMGLNTWAAFVGTNDKAAIAGDVAMLASEVLGIPMEKLKLVNSDTASVPRGAPEWRR